MIICYLLILGSQTGGRKDPVGANIQEARREMTKTKEQLVEEKKISLSIRIKPIDVDSLGIYFRVSSRYEFQAGHQQRE